MNKRLYRIIFNKKRGQLMAVAETAAGDGKSAGTTGKAAAVGTPLLATLRPLSFSLLAALGLAICISSTADAQTVAYRNAPANQQPTVLNAGNGVPLVNIQTPSAAGISRNVYSQFDVLPDGTILNNSRTNTQTQLGGWVQGNPWLAGGTARVILNEVVSANPSLLRGYIEVAGSSAQVVIANPAGVTCNGCGFINANRATLTTGTPIITGGNLDGYRVEGGIVSIQGAGLDASRATHTDLIARAVEINAGLWANNLKVTAGANQVNAEHTQATPIAGQGVAPAFAIDVAQLGGMYAGKITLVGTEAGVGVRNAGQIGASAGEVVITADGRLHNSGHISSAAQMQIDTPAGIDNSGTIYAQGDVRLSTRGHIDNAGLIAAQGSTTLSATGIGSRISGTAASVLGAGVNAEGGLGGNARLDVVASDHLALHGQNLSSGDQTITASSLDLTDSQSSAQNLSLTASNGNLDARRAVLTASGTLSATTPQSLLHDNASSSAQQLQLAAHDISNDHGELVQTGSGSTAITLAGVLNNTQGRLATNSQNLNLAAQTIDNTAGHITASGDIQLATQVLHNAQGQISAGQALQITTSQNIDNTQGLLVANGKVNLHSVGVDNTLGTIASVLGNVAADAGSALLKNTGGRIEAAQDIALAGSGMTNAGGLIVGQNLALDSRTQAFDNSAGTLASGGLLNLQSGALSNSAGLIQASGALNIDTHGQTLSNINSGSSAGIIGQSTVNLSTGDLNNATGFIGAKGLLNIASAAITNTSGGVLSSEQAIQLTGSRLDNQGGQIQALDAASLQIGGAVNNTAGLIRTGQALSVTAASITNSGTQGANQGIEGRSQSLTANQIDNSTGAIRADQALGLTSDGTINNTNGLISAAHTLSILDPNASASNNSASKTLAITNSGGILIADQLLSIDSASLTGDGSVLGLNDISVKLLSAYTHTGQLSANGNATLETAGILTNRARIQAGNGLTLKAATLDNEAAGEIAATTLHLRATAANTLTNRGLIDGADTFIDSATVNNLGTGRIYGDHVAIAATTLNNEAENGVAPVIAARNRLDIGAGTINNREHALLFSAGDLAIGGALDTNHLATGQAATLNNASASIEALGNLAINAGQINNTNEHFSITVATLGSSAITEYQGSGAATRYTAGTPGVYIYNDESDHLMTPQGAYSSWLGYHYTRTTTETQVLTTDPGKIIAGSGMQLTANTVFNSNSQIMAGGALNGNIGTLNNSETPGARALTDAGTVTSYWRDHEKGRDRTGSSMAAYTPPSTIQAISLGTTVYQPNTGITGSGTTVAARSVNNVSQSAAGIHAVSVPVRNLQPAPRITQVSAAGAMVVRTITPSSTLPNNSLFHTNTSPTSHYLIETDPRFASYRQWLSSDVMLAALALDPATTQKRLGDGFYEQRLVREQLAQLTGRRFLDGYANDEAQYQALMNAGVTYAKEWKLIPGVALTAAQMASLTTDIVWLVEQEIDLGNGQTTKALVPQVYARLKDGDLAPSGALIAAHDINLNLTGDLTNSGTIAGRQIVALSAGNISNLGGRISGQDVLVAARNDLTNLGGTLSAENQLIASAGHDLTVASTTRTQTNAQGSRTNIDRIAGLYVTGPNGNLIVSAGHDLTLLAAALINVAPTAAGTSTTTGTTTPSSTEAGRTVLAAGHDLTLGTVSEASSNRIVWDGKNRRSDSRQTDVGTTLQTTGDLTLEAGHDLSAKAASVTSDQGALTVVAGNNVTLGTGQSSASVDEAHQHKEKGFFSSKTTTTRDTLDETTSVGSAFSGNTTTVQAGQDLIVQGSTLLAMQDATLQAGRDLIIAAASESHSETHFREAKKSGFLSKGLDAMNKSRDEQGAQGSIVSAGRDLALTAGANAPASSGSGDLTIQASAIAAGNDLAIQSAGDLQLLAALSQTRESIQHTKQTSKKLETLTHRSAIKSTYWEQRDSSTTPIDYEERRAYA